MGASRDNLLHMGLRIPAPLAGGCGTRGLGRGTHKGLGLRPWDTTVDGLHMYSGEIGPTVARCSVGDGNGDRYRQGRRALGWRNSRLAGCSPGAYRYKRKQTTPKNNSRVGCRFARSLSLQEETVNTIEQLAVGSPLLGTRYGTGYRVPTEGGCKGDPKS